MLVVNLISTVVISGVLIAFIDFIFYLLFGRYIYLYRLYLDNKKKDINNKGNFDEIRSDIKDAIDNIKDKTDLDEKFIDFKDKVENTVDDIKDKTNDFIKDNKLDEKFEDVKDNISDVVDNLKEKTNDFINNDSNTKTAKNNKTTKKKGVDK